MPQARFYGFPADRRHYKLIAPKGEMPHYILCVADAPTKCVRCAPQSGNPQPSGQRPVKPENPPAFREALINSQNRISYEFLSNASS